MNQNQSTKKYKTICRSAVALEYDRDVEHSTVVGLLKAAIMNADMKALLQLHEHITDVRSA